MNAETSALSFPFVLQDEQNKHVQLVKDEQVLELINEIFSAVKEKSELISHFRIAREGVLMTDDEKGALIESLDYSSVDSFKETLDAQCQSDNYLIYISGWNNLGTELTNDLVDYLKLALNLKDELIADADYELFVGKYTKTYGGVHRAECSNLQYVFSGDKTFSYWHPDKDMGPDVERKIDEYSNRAEEYLLKEPANITENEILLKGGKGSVFYIPHSWWHVGSSPELSISVTIAIYHD